MGDGPYREPPAGSFVVGGVLHRTEYLGPDCHPEQVPYTITSVEILEDAQIPGMRWYRSGQRCIRLRLLGPSGHVIEELYDA
jgi:hypothetical protein